MYSFKEAGTPTKKKSCLELQTAERVNNPICFVSLATISILVRIRLVEFGTFFADFKVVSRLLQFCNAFFIHRRIFFFALLNEACLSHIPALPCFELASNMQT